MKKYLHNRNERLFNKLFEKQGVKVNFEKKALQETAPIVDPGPSALNVLEAVARKAAKDMIAAGATVERMMEFLGTLDATMFNEFDYGKGKERGPTNLTQRRCQLGRTFIAKRKNPFGRKQSLLRARL